MLEYNRNRQTPAMRPEKSNLVFYYLTTRKFLSAKETPVNRDRFRYRFCKKTLHNTRLVKKKQVSFPAFTKIKPANDLKPHLNILFSAPASENYTQNYYK